jgi:peptidoglycan/LPS O-acetylase OafA/YrhL
MANMPNNGNVIKVHDTRFYDAALPGSPLESVTVQQASVADLSPPGTIRHQHLQALDGVRGVALLLIFVDHFLATNNVARNPLLQVALDMRDLSWTGVYLFFVLSGFLITGILYDTLDTENYFSAFYGRRVLRIFPLYYGFLGVLFLLTAPLHLHWNGQMWMLWTYTPNILFHSQFESIPASYLNLRHFWSLAIEEQFYLLWPFIVFWARSWRRVMTAALAGTLLSLGVRSLLVVYGRGTWFHTTLCALDALLPGGALALLVRSRFRDRTLRLGLPVFLVAMAIVLWQNLRPPFFHPSELHFFHPDHSHFLGTVGLTLISIGYAGLIAAAQRPESFVRRIFSNRVLCFFGTYSYGLYVFHYSLDAAFTHRLRGFLVARHVPLAASICLTALLLAALSTAIAYVSYHLYEKRFLQLKRFFPYRRRPSLTDG